MEEAVVFWCLVMTYGFLTANICPSEKNCICVGRAKRCLLAHHTESYCEAKVDKARKSVDVSSVLHGEKYAHILLPSSPSTNSATPDSPTPRPDPRPLPEDITTTTTTTTTTNAPSTKAPTTLAAPSTESPLDLSTTPTPTNISTTTTTTMIPECPINMTEEEVQEVLDIRLLRQEQQEALGRGELYKPLDTSSMKEKEEEEEEDEEKEAKHAIPCECDVRELCQKERICPAPFLREVECQDYCQDYVYERFSSSSSYYSDSPDCPDRDDDGALVALAVASALNASLKLFVDHDKNHGMSEELIAKVVREATNEVLSNFMLEFRQDKNNSNNNNINSSSDENPDLGAAREREEEGGGGENFGPTAEAQIPANASDLGTSQLAVSEKEKNCTYFCHRQNSLILLQPPPPPTTQPSALSSEKEDEKEEKEEELKDDGEDGEGGGGETVSKSPEGPVAVHHYHYGDYVTLVLGGLCLLLLPQHPLTALCLRSLKHLIESRCSRPSSRRRRRRTSQTSHDLELHALPRDASQQQQQQQQQAPGTLQHETQQHEQPQQLPQPPPPLTVQPLPSKDEPAVLQVVDETVDSSATAERDEEAGRDRGREEEEEEEDAEEEKNRLSGRSRFYVSRLEMPSFKTLQSIVAYVDVEKEESSRRRRPRVTRAQSQQDLGPSSSYEMKALDRSLMVSSSGEIPPS